jgi:hypothetical protein
LLNQSDGNTGFTGSGTGGDGFAELVTGWTAGGGVEWMFTQNWSVKVEYLHYDLGTASFSWVAQDTTTNGANVGAIELLVVRADSEIKRHKTGGATLFLPPPSSPFNDTIDQPEVARVPESQPRRVEQPPPPPLGPDKRIPRSRDYASAEAGS